MSDREKYQNISLNLRCCLEDNTENNKENYLSSYFLSPDVTDKLNELV